MLTIFVVDKQFLIRAHCYIVTVDGWLVFRTACVLFCIPAFGFSKFFLEKSSTVSSEVFSMFRIQNMQSHVQRRYFLKWTLCYAIICHSCTITRHVIVLKQRPIHIFRKNPKSTCVALGFSSRCRCTFSYFS
jgi:hypothetical protein